jgi:hypothetical protein
LQPHYVTINGETIIKSVVRLDHYDCKTYDHIVIETTPGRYTAAEVYGGYSSTHSEMVMFGDLHSYNFPDIYDEDGDEIGSLWIDDYLVGINTVKQWYHRE